MKSLWTGLYDNFKDRRYGTLFIFSSLALALIFFIGQLCRELYSQYHDQIDALMVVATAMLLIVAFLMARREFLRARRMRTGSDAARLSSDELTKARSKLLRNRHR